jgi:hypothetical protein
VLRRLGGQRLLLLPLHSLLTRSCLPNCANSTLHFASKGSAATCSPMLDAGCDIAAPGVEAVWLPCPLSNAAFYLDQRREIATKGSALCAAAGLGRAGAARAGMKPIRLHSYTAPQTKRHKCVTHGVTLAFTSVMKVLWKTLELHCSNTSVSSSYFVNARAAKYKTPITKPRSTEIRRDD